jgi:DnaJ-class molecular chaperone
MSNERERIVERIKEITEKYGPEFKVFCETCGGSGCDSFAEPCEPCMDCNGEGENKITAEIFVNNFRDEDDIITDDTPPHPCRIKPVIR